MRVLNKTKFTTSGKLILILIAFLSIGYWWVSSYVWFRIDDRKITINGKSLFEAGAADYSCFKSLAGDILCVHQDNGTQYFISPKNNEVSVISVDVDVINLEMILISSGAHTGFESTRLKQRLSDTKLIVGKDFVEFTPSITQWKSQAVERWHISY
jgi:hypothetical protein